MSNDEQEQLACWVLLGNDAHRLPITGPLREIGDRIKQAIILAGKLAPEFQMTTRKHRVHFHCPACGWKGERHPLAQKCGHCGTRLEMDATKELLDFNDTAQKDLDQLRIDMSKKIEEKPKSVCPCWSGRWHELKFEGIPVVPPKFELRCDYCKRVFQSKGSGPFDNEKAGVAVGNHHEAECEPA